MYQKRYDSGRKGKRPTRFMDPYPPADLQQLLPAGWCIRCGREIYRPKRELCEKCKGFERRMRNEQRKISKSLLVLHRGS